MELLSPSERWSEGQDKVAEYLAAGVRLGWVVDPPRRQVHLYRGMVRKRSCRRPTRSTAKASGRDSACRWPTCGGSGAASAKNEAAWEKFIRLQAEEERAHQENRE